jgi:inner membrane protein
MALTWTHAFFAVAAGKTVTSRKLPLRFWLLIAVCAGIPDIDVFWRGLVTDRSGIWVHRGIAHSLLAAVLFGLLAAVIYWVCKPRISNLQGQSGGSNALATSQPPGQVPRRGRAFPLFWLVFTLATASHAFLDMLSSGYRGVMLLAPFDDYRYSFSWQPIWSMPHWVAQMFPNLMEHGGRGTWIFRATISEVVVVWVPMTVLLLFSRSVRRLRSKNHGASK